MNHEFDITADLSRQRSGDKKIVKLFDSGLDVTYPLVAWIEGRNIPVSFTRGGREGTWPCNDELHTLPETLPLIVTYHNVYHAIIGPMHDSISSALGAMSEQLAVIEMIFDPNTGIASAKTVWRKRE